jgi:hypothetical protein
VPTSELVAVTLAALSILSAVAVLVGLLAR